MSIEFAISQGNKGQYNGQLFDGSGNALVNITAGSKVYIYIGRRDNAANELAVTDVATTGGSSTSLTVATGVFTLTIGAVDSQALQDGQHDVEVILVDAGDSNALKRADFGTLHVLPSRMTGTQINTLTDICSISEVLTFLGMNATATDAQRGLCVMAKKMAESAVRNFLGYGVTQRAYTGILLPDTNLFYSQADYIDVVNNRLSLWGWSDTSIAQVQELPVRSVQKLSADFSALAGQGAMDFSSTTDLLIGTDFYIDWDVVTDPTPNALNGVSWTGHIVRWISAWPARRRSIKINYTAGLTAAELDGQSTTWLHSKDVSQIKWATVKAAAARFKAMQAYQDGHGLGGAGPITSEHIGDASFSYQAEAVRGMLGVSLPMECQYELMPFKRMSLR